jgi:hypothetical protein
MPTAHRLSFPTCCPTPGVYTFTVTKTVLRLLTSLALGFNNRPDRKSQSSVAATGPLPGVLTSSTHSLTWRESLTGLATCSFQPQPPPSPGESVTHRSDNLFPSTRVPTQSGNYEAQHEHTLASKPPAVKHCATTTVHGKHRHGLSQTGDRQTLQHNKARKYGTLRFSQPATQDDFLVLVSGLRKGAQRSHAQA